MDSSCYAIARPCEIIFNQLSLSMLSKNDLQDDEVVEEEFDDDDLMYKLREERMAKLKSKGSSDDTEYGNGMLSSITNERELMSMSTSIPRLIILFTHPDFKRCKTMHKHLSSIAKQRPRARFVCIDACSAPFMVLQMTVKVLPCLVVIKDGHAVQRLVGFDGLKSTDGEDFNPKNLDDWLVKTKIFD